jgi:bifunctional enzyme CysN/CysC
MATAASHADALLLVIEANSGLKAQTLTHLNIASLLGINHVIVAVNKMDLARHSEKTFKQRKEEVLDKLARHSFATSEVIPVSGLTGVNIVKRGRQMEWWSGPTLLEALDNLASSSPSLGEPLCSIQDIRRIPGGGRRYFASLISGELRNGMSIAKPGHRGVVNVRSVNHSGRSVQTVSAPAEISLELAQEIDLERGDVLAVGDRLDVTDHLEGRLVWLNPSPGHPGRRVEFRLGHSSVKATVTRAWGLDPTLAEKTGEVKEIRENSITRVTIELAKPVALAPHSEIAELGRFVLADFLTGDTLAAGTVLYGLRRSQNIIPHDFTLRPEDFENLTGVRGKVAWFTGLSGSGKSTIANEVSQDLHEKGIPHSILDGDTLRKGLTKDLGFTEADRIENIRRTAEVAKLMADSGLFVLVSLISPYRADRESAATIVGSERFVEIFVDTPLEVCEARDPKGLYKKARSGDLPQFTGIDSPYEVPLSPSIRLDGRESISSLKAEVLKVLI